MIVEYNGNNSGGNDWLNSGDRQALRDAGWRVLDTGLSTHALRQGDDLKEIIEEFERVASQDVRAIGCNCCGPPHSFSYWPDQNDIDAITLVKERTYSYYKAPEDWPYPEYIHPSDYTRTVDVPFDF